MRINTICAPPSQIDRRLPTKRQWLRIGFVCPDPQLFSGLAEDSTCNINGDLYTIRPKIVDYDKPFLTYSTYLHATM